MISKTPRITFRFVAAFVLLIFSCASSNAQDENKLGIRFYGSFLYTEKVPNALFFFSDIEQNDSFELRKALRNHDIEILVLSSFGGSVWEGLNMAGIIHDKELTTYVPEVSVDGGGNCASACSFMFFGGKTRVSDGKVGVHQFYSGSASKSANIGKSQEVAQFTVSEIIGFLNEFETPPFVFERMFQQSDMYYFDEREMDKITRLAKLLKEEDRSRIASFIDDFNVELALLEKELEEEENKKEPQPVKKEEPKVSPEPKKEYTDYELETKICTDLELVCREGDCYKEHVRNIQIELNRLNCNAGVEDGIPGEKTRKATERFLKNIGSIPPDRKYKPVWYTNPLLCKLKNSNKKCAVNRLNAALVCKNKSPETNTSMTKIQINNFTSRAKGSEHKILYCYPDETCFGKTTKYVDGNKPHFFTNHATKDVKIYLEDENTRIRVINTIQNTSWGDVYYTCELK